MATKLPNLDPIRTGAVWEQDFLFTLADCRTPQTVWQGCTAEVVITPLTASFRSAYSFRFSGAQVVVWEDEARVGIRVSDVQTREIFITAYAIEVYRITPAGARYSVAVGVIQAVQSLNEVIEGESSEGPPPIQGAVHGTIIVAALGVARATGAGPKGDQGPAGPGVADQVAYDDTVTQLGATQMQAAFEALVLRVKALEQGQPPPADGTLDFSQDGNAFVAAL